MPLDNALTNRYALFCGIFLLTALRGLSQDSLIHLRNPSFEDTAPAIQAPQGWFSAGFEGESPPDIQPGHFGCKKEPLEGNTYLGLVTRDNGTWERVGQQLPAPLLKDSLYEFSVCMAVSADYISLSRVSGKTVNYTAPTLLRLWGINISNKNAELLAESPVVTHSQWVRYKFSLLPSRSDADVLLLEAYYSDGARPVNGHLLLDNCSPLELVTNSPLADSLRRLRAVNQPFLRSEVSLYNPSFEWGPNNILPTGWLHTSPGFETAIRTHPPVLGDFFYVESVGPLPYSRDIPRPTTAKPHGGRRYLSLLASDEGKTQQVSQQLDVALKKDTLYHFSAQLARSKHFRDQKTPDGKRQDFKNPLRLRVWGGTLQKPKTELLAVSPAVVNTEWKKFNFTLKPLKSHYACLSLEAWYVSDFGKPYNGNLLVDDCYLGKKQE